MSLEQQALNEHVHGRINYHTRTATPEIVIDADGIPGNRIDPELEPVIVELHDARNTNVDLDFHSDGLSFVRAPTSVGTFRDPGAVRDTYDRELTELLRAETGATEVVVFDHTVRIDDEGTRPPARHVHGDYNAASAQRRLIDILGESRATEWGGGHFAIVNVWRPIECVVEQVPLAFADPKTVAASDWIDIDIVYPDRRGQITGLVRQPTHRWIYLSRMRPDEAAIFSVYDNRGRPAIAHSAVELLNDRDNVCPRRSIESRTLVRFDE